jgi:hypothetical protein
MDILEAWNRRRELRFDGMELHNLGNSKEGIEADILYTSSAGQLGQGDIVFYNAVLEKYGNVEIKWEDKDAIVEGVRYKWEEGSSEVPTGDLKVFVWEGVLSDYTDGLVMALAYDKEQALKLIEKECSYCIKCIKNIEPRIMNAPEAIVLWGGG